MKKKEKKNPRQPHMKKTLLYPLLMDTGLLSKWRSTSCSWRSLQLSVLPSSAHKFNTVPPKQDFLLNQLIQKSIWKRRLIQEELRNIFTRTMRNQSLN